jgi:isocitrate dehydrogenase
MSKKISVHVDLMESDKELDEILDNCKINLNNIAKKAANNYEKQLLQFAIRNKAKQVYVVCKKGINIETSCWEIDCQFFTDKEVACTYARMSKSTYTCEIIGHELGQLANIPDDVFESIQDDGNKELAAEYRRVMREKK